MFERFAALWRRPTVQLSNHRADRSRTVPCLERLEDRLAPAGLSGPRERLEPQTAGRNVDAAEKYWTEMHTSVAGLLQKAPAARVAKLI